MDRKVIKLECAYGSDRQFIVVKRNQDLRVRDIMEEVQRVFKIPVEEQVIFFKGRNLTESIHELVETMAVANNQQIRVTRDPDLPNRSPNSQRMYMMQYAQQQQQQQQPQQQQLYDVQSAYAPPPPPMQTSYTQYDPPQQQQQQLYSAAPQYSTQQPQYSSGLPQQSYGSQSYT